MGSLNNGGFPKTLIEHWDGSAWGITTSPSPGHDTLFTSVSPVASDDVWAAGQYQAVNGSLQPLYEHWDGDAWTQVPPHPALARAAA